MPQPDRTYDAIVIGSGISGGWAAKELCDHGLKTLVLERGRDVQHIKDYPTANMAPWELPHRGFNPRKLIDANPLISKAAGYGEDTAHFFVKDADHPYVQEKPFDWIRGYQVGGKSLIWGRATQRWSKYAFVAPETLGYGMNWPITYDDIAWVVQGRWAHLSKPKPIHLQQGRGSCQAGHPLLGYVLGGLLTAVAVLVSTSDSCIPSFVYRSIFGFPPRREAL